jgi:hypothetical protein
VARDYAHDPDPGPGGAAVAPCGTPRDACRLDEGPRAVVCRCAGLRRCDVTRAVAACLSETPGERPGLSQVRRRLRAPLSCRGCRQTVAAAIMEAVVLAGEADPDPFPPVPDGESPCSA